jgi:hypothetical protein
VPREKREGDPAQEKGPREATLRQEVSLREHTCAKNCSPRDARASFCAGPYWTVRQIASRQTSHRAGCRRGSLPLLLHSQNGRSDLTYDPQTICAGERGRRRASGAARNGPAGKKTGGPAPGIAPV